MANKTEKREELKKFPPIWKPTQQDEEFQGVIVGTLDSEKYGFGLILKDDKGINHATPAHKNLAGTLSANFTSGNIKLGDKIVITYLGMKQVKKAKGGMTDPFNDYKVEKVN
jgi:hypothetical protein